MILDSQKRYWAQRDLDLEAVERRVWFVAVAVFLFIYFIAALASSFTDSRADGKLVEDSSENRASHEQDHIIRP